ncbi:MAG: response regulator transcription factor [Janthinobacterium lividum]
MQARNQQFERLSQFVSLVSPQGESLFGVMASLASTAYSVAILEGNSSLARLLATGFAAESIRVQTHEELDTAMQQLEAESPDLLILDLDLEGVDGLALLGKLRVLQPSMRLLVLSSRAGTEWAVEALNRGADDYLVKPFSLLEIMARVGALRRRSGELVHTPKSWSGSLVLDKKQSRVTWQGKAVNLTPRECELLEFMMAHPGTTLSRSTLSQQVWNIPAEANTNIVDVYVKYLRDKLESVYAQKMIRTVRGVGYVFQHES